MMTTWLSTVVIVINDCQIICDVYGTSNDNIWLIQSLSKNFVTKVIDSWCF